MKTNTLHSISIFCKSLAIAIVLVIMSAMSTAKAQTTVPNLNESSFNGLFTPTSAQRFFEEGRSSMDRETQILTNPEHYFSGDILQLNTIDIKLLDELEETQPIPNFPEDSPQNELE